MKRSEVEEEREFIKRLRYYRRIFESYLFKRKVSNLSFWHTDLKANNLSEGDRKSVGLYPMNFVAKVTYKKHRDNDGVIMLDYGGELGVQYNPNAIAQAALGFYDLYMQSSELKNRKLQQELDIKSFFTQVDWFVTHGRRVKNNILLWEYEFPFESREYLQKPWRSALAQGQAISVLIRAYILSEKEVYLKAAHDGFNAFRHEGLEHEGGVIFRNKEDVWLEEAIIKKPNHILNGFVWALWGVRDYAVFTRDEYAIRLYEEAEKTLRRTLNLYDLGFWTCYDCVTDMGDPIMPVSSYYQRLHITQMLGMYELTNKEDYYLIYKKWRSYYQNRFYKIFAFCWKCYFKVRYW